jgi:hypothetical protein
VSIAKFLTAVIGAAGEAVNVGLVHGTAAHWVTIGIAVVTAIAVYLVPNKVVVPPTPLKG